MNYFIFDIPRDAESNPIEPEDKVRCPNCPQHRIMNWHSGLESWICPNCAYQVTKAYDQLPLPSQESRLEPQSKGKEKFFMKSFSSNNRELGYEESIISDRGEDNKKYVGSAQDALKEELGQFNSRRIQERDDNLREFYNDTQLNQGTENEILKYRAERERRKRVEEDI